ncbi:MAG: hypothetical protein F6K11_34065 [Leptolyngbya sp. SIO3F4]|nr:hypothetical protein [Leptolyngbya sp. SIO3F4]
MARSFLRFCLGGLLTLLSLGFLEESVLANQRISITLQADNVKDYGRLLEQAVVAGNDAISNTFEANPDTAPVKLTVLVNRNGQVLPILVAEVSRDEWQQQSDVQSWARYSTSARTLLGYAQPSRIATRREPYNHQAFLVREAIIDELD